MNGQPDSDPETSLYSCESDAPPAWDEEAILALPGARRRARADAFTGWLLVATTVLCALSYSFEFITFTHAKLAVLSGGLALASVGLIWRGALSTRGIRALLPLWAGLLVVVWAGLFLKGVQRPEAVIEAAVRNALYLTAGLVAFDLLEQRAWRRRMRAAIVFSALIVAVLGMAQLAGLAELLLPSTGPNDQAVYSVFGNQDFYGGYLALGLALSVIPALTSTRQGWWWLLIFTVLLAGVGISASRSAWLAGGAGVLIVLLRPGGPVCWSRAGVCLLLTVLVCGVCIWQFPERTVERITDTMRPGDEGGHLRLWFWSGATIMMGDHPALGVGLGNFSYWSPVYQGAALDMPGGELLEFNMLHTLHAHSEPLEVMVECGLVGLAFLFWMLLALLPRRGPEWPGLVALATFCLFNSPLHSPPFGLVAVLLACMLLARDHRAPLQSEDSLPFAWVTTGLAMALAVAVVWVTLIPSVLLARAEEAHVNGENPIAQYERVLAHNWPAPEAREAYAIALYEQGKLELAQAQLLLASRGLDTGRLHLLLGRVAQALGEEVLARSSMDAVLARWPWNAEALVYLHSWAGPEEQALLESHAARWGLKVNLE